MESSTGYPNFPMVTFGCRRQTTGYRYAIHKGDFGLSISVLAAVQFYCAGAA